MIKKTGLGIVIFILLAGIYIIPEETKNIALASAFLLMLYYTSVRYCRLINLKAVVFWVLFILLGGIAALISGLSLSTTFELSIAILLGVMIGNVYIYPEVRYVIFKWLFFITLIVVAGCVLQLTNPSLLSRVTSLTLGSEKFFYFKDFLSYNALVGFSYQTGVTGFYLAILDGIILCYFLGKKDKSRWFTILMIASYVCIYVLILLTGKRSQLLAVLILSTIIFAMYNKKHVFKIAFVSLVLVIGGAVLLYNTNAGQIIIARSQGINATTGRNYIYSILIQNFFNNPVIGNGFGYTLKTINRFANGHNVYLQVLSENGIIGFLLYMSLLVMYTKQAVECLKSFIRNNENSYILSMCLYIEGLFILNSFIGNPLYDVYPIILYLIVTGIVASTLKDLRTGNVWMINH